MIQERGSSEIPHWKNTLGWRTKRNIVNQIAGQSKQQKLCYRNFQSFHQTYIHKIVYLRIYIEQKVKKLTEISDEIAHWENTL